MNKRSLVLLSCLSMFAGCHASIDARIAEPSAKAESGPKIGDTYIADYPTALTPFHREEAQFNAVAELERAGITDWKLKPKEHAFIGMDDEFRVLGVPPGGIKFMIITGRMKGDIGWMTDSDLKECKRK